MKTTLLTIALAAATLPLSFAAPQASTPAKSNTATTQTTKKHVKKTHKTKKASTAAKPSK